MEAAGLDHSSQAHGLRLVLLGSFAVQIGAKELSAEALRRKDRHLLQLLALQPDHRMHREQALERLWPELSPDAAAAQLYNALSRLRKVLSDAAPQLTREELYFDVTTDVAEFEALAEGALHTLEAADLEQAISLYGGDLLPAERYEEWTLEPREALQEGYLSLLVALGDVYLQHGRLAAAAASLQKVLRYDPTRQGAHHQLMRLHALKRDRDGLERQYQRYCRALAEALDAEPAEETSRLYHELLARLSPPPHNLPAQATPFIGREGELAEITRRLTSPFCRLLTLTGPGGTGKTRLALEVAGGQLEAFPDGVYFVPLAGVNTPEFLVSAVADTLKISSYSREEPKAQLLNYLREKALLLVLDNLEHLLSGVELVAEILKGAAAVKILATSRERLNLQAEWLYEVGGLSFPESEVALVEAYDAVQLFVAAASRADKGFVLRAGNRRSVARSCQLVQGMPLAIELAASWKRLLSCREIADEIARGIDFLSSASRDLPPRHHSIRAVFDHSWRLLSEPERRAFGTLSVFRGGFTREAAKVVAGTSLKLLSALADKSLLYRDAEGRYAVHELLRQYAQDKLSQEELVKRRHAGYYASFLVGRKGKLQGWEQQALHEIEAEIDNVRAALQWCLAMNDLDAGAEIGLGLWRFWLIRGYLGEGHTQLLRLAALTTEKHLPMRAKLLSAAGTLVQNQGDASSAQPLFEEALALSRKLNDEAGAAASLNHLGWLAWRRGDYKTASTLSQESLVIYEGLGDKRGIATSLNNLGWVTHHQGNFADAHGYHRRSLALRRELGDKRAVAFSLTCSGWTLQRRGEYERAEESLEEALVLFGEIGERQLFAFALCISAQGLRDRSKLERAEARLEEALKIFREIGDNYGIALATKTLGDTMRLRGQPARTLYEESLRLRETIGDKWGMGATLSALAELAHEDGEAAGAAELYTQSLSLRYELRDKHGIALCLFGKARLALDRPLRALRLLAAAAALLEAIGAPLAYYRQDRFDTLLAVLRQNLDEATFLSTWREGKAMNLDEMIAYALDAPSST